MPARATAPASFLEQCMGGFEALLVSTLTVALAEIGDKTQLLALVLAAKYRKPWPIIAGILAATLVNHAASAWVGAWLSAMVPANVLQWIIAISFFAVALWALVPDKLDEDKDAAAQRSAWGVFAATCIAFFLVEIGDKTQVATVVLAARYHPLWQVVTGTTLGMLLANAPVVLFGARFAHKLPLKAARWTAAALFAVLGLWVAISGL
jgi:putative Ca2+/H+ antiporter (TMEM165/GDT1 family)